MKRRSFTIPAILLLMFVSLAHGQSGVTMQGVTLSGTSGGASCATATESCTEASTGTSDVGRFASTVYYASSFTASAETLCSIKVALSKAGSPTNGTLYVYNDSSGSPGTAVGGSATIVSASVGASEADYTVTLSSGALTNTATYWIVIKAGAVDSGNYIKWHYVGSSACTPHAIKYSADGSSWSSGSTTATGKFINYK